MYFKKEKERLFENVIDYGLILISFARTLPGFSALQ